VESALMDALTAQGVSTAVACVRWLVASDVAARIAADVGWYVPVDAAA
jgi:hypothetical protein